MPWPSPLSSLSLSFRPNPVIIELHGSGVDAGGALDDNELCRQTAARRRSRRRASRARPASRGWSCHRFPPRPRDTTSFGVGGASATPTHFPWAIRYCSRLCRTGFQCRRSRRGVAVTLETVVSPAFGSLAAALNSRFQQTTTETVNCRRWSQVKPACTSPGEATTVTNHEKRPSIADWGPQRTPATPADRPAAEDSCLSAARRSGRRASGRRPRPTTLFSETRCMELAVPPKFIVANRARVRTRADRGRRHCRSGVAGSSGSRPSFSAF